MSQSFDVIVAGLHLRWDGVWQRPNHVLSRFARTTPVIVLEEPLAGDVERDVVRTEPGGVTVITPVRQAWVDTVDARVFATLQEQVGSRAPLMWLYTPQMLPLCDAFPAAPMAFDKMDELANFKDADARIRLRETAVLERAVVAFAGGRTLYDSIRDRSQRARCYPSGVDAAHFDRAIGMRKASDRPRLVYMGVIDERLDLDLLAAIAAMRPHWSLTVAGPVAKIDPDSLPQAPNIHYVGRRAYDELPALLADADVGLMPFALNDATRSISPTKTLEYMAAGLPVVSTRVPDVVSQYGEGVWLADEAAAFVAAIEVALRGDAVRAERARQYVRAGDWDAIADGMSRDLTTAGLLAGPLATRV